MEIIKPSFRPVKAINGLEILVELDSAARLCYKSEGNINYDNLGNVIKHCIKSGHESVLESVNLSFNVILDNGILREWTRHRIASYSVESTRYCDYTKKGVRFIKPLEFEEGSNAYDIWYASCESCEDFYNKLADLQCQPQEKRSVLNFSVACEMRFTANIRSMRNLLRLRCAKDAHLHMRELCIPMLFYLQDKIPIVFDDIEYDKSFVDKYLDGDRNNYTRYLNRYTVLDSYDSIIMVEHDKIDIIHFCNTILGENINRDNLIHTYHSSYFTSDVSAFATASLIKINNKYEVALYLRADGESRTGSIQITSDEEPSHLPAEKQIRLVADAIKKIFSDQFKEAEFQYVDIETMLSDMFGDTYKTQR